MLPFCVHSQSDTLAVDSVPEPIVQFKPKPSLMLGLGTFTFYGDTGNGLRSNSPLTSSAALNVGVNMPLRSNIDISFSAVFSTLTLNEPGLDFRNNFRSNISGGSAIVTYNFNDILPKDAYVQPYIGTGISTFEFLSKADLFDGDGNEYHLWQNGTLMSLPEDASDAGDAIMLERDYVYETDLRRLNRDGEGNYPDRTVSIPLSLGVNFNLSKHIKGQLGTTMFFNFNDLVDDVNNDGNGSDGRKDRFLHSSLSVSYDLHVPRKKKKSFDVDFDEEDSDLMAFDYFDSDKDGVNDLDDDCLGHPEGVEVDEKGCPVDNDGDGVADFKDDEPYSEQYALVDEFGVTVDEDTYLNKYMFWIDSLGDDGWDELYTRVEGEKSKETFSILVLPDRKGMNQGEINSLLAEGDVRSIEEDGEQGFLVGDFESLSDAVNKKIELQELGFVGAVQKELDGNRKDIDDELGGITSVVEERIKVLGAPEMSDEVMYRVQVGAFRYDLSDNIFTGIDDIIALKGQDGLNRYMTKTYSDAKSAAERRIELLTEGFEGAFITAYKKGERITLAEAGLNVVKGKSDLTEDKENNSITKSSVRFQIQLGEYVDDIPTEMLEKYLEIGKVKPQKESVVTRYMFGDFSSYPEAKTFLETIKGKGIEQAEIKGLFEGRIISLEEALNIIGEQDQSYAE
ncbi:MAG: hypothetical protein AB8B53_10930 [Flavobacteriales bacterium]